MGNREAQDTQEEISTEPGFIAGKPALQPGSSLQRSPSRALLWLKVAHVIGASGLTAYNIPFAQEMYRKGDWIVMAGVAVAVVLIATRAGFADVKDAAIDLVTRVLPFGKKK